MASIEKKIVSDEEAASVEQYEGGDDSSRGGGGNIILDSLMRVRAKDAQNQQKRQDKARFGKVGSKVKKDVKVEERVKRQTIKAKIADFMGGMAARPSALHGAHSPNTRTVGLWADVLRKSSRSRGGTPR